MRHILLVTSCWLAAASAASAQVFVRAPFVRVQTGPGVVVQAPFVNVFVPPAPLVGPGPVYVVPPPSIYIPPMPAVVPQVQVVPSAPPPVVVAPAPVQPVVVQAMTLDQFAAGFKARGGSFDVDLINPISGRATKVHFTLPPGTPKRVIVNPREVEFRYGVFHFVRIEFDRKGAQVVTRMGR